MSQHPPQFGFAVTHYLADPSHPLGYQAYSSPIYTTLRAAQIEADRLLRHYLNLNLDMGQHGVYCNDIDLVKRGLITANVPVCTQGDIIFFEQRTVSEFVIQTVQPSGGSEKVDASGRVYGPSSVQDWTSPSQ